MEINLSGQVAIVTGSSQGIGRVTAEVLAECGAAVVLNTHSDGELLEKVVDGIRARGGQATGIVADVKRKPEAQKLIDAAMQLGGIDILVNNAGGLVKRVPVAEFDENHFQKVVDINLKSTFVMSNLVMPYMKMKKHGRIINLSSQAAHDGGGPGAAVYASTKGGIWTMTKSLAKELAPFGILVNCVAPGFIGETAFHTTFTAPEVHARVVTQIPLGRKGVPLDVAKAVLFLASDLADYVTGQTIEVNGGLCMY
jgi:3-oxoacyl-[acyl-carrier protein] reductase